MTLIDSDFIMVNAPLARHYGLTAGPKGMAFERVAIGDDHKRGAAGLILESPFISIPEMSKRVIPYLPVRWLMATKMDNAAKAPGLKLPLLVNHAVHDEIVPVEQGRAVFEAAHTGQPEAERPHKELYLIPEGGHNDLVWERAEYQRRFLKFVDHVRSPK